MTDVNENSIDTGINHEKWKKAILVTQLVLAGIIFLTEIVNNIILYKTGSQGYGPDTVVQKFFRYLVLTSLINFISIVTGQLIIKKSENLNLHKYTLIIVTEIICINAAFSHYQFASIFGIFAIPIMLSVLYEDRKLCICSFVIGMAGLTLSVVARASDPLYNKDIAPESAVGYVIIICFFVLSRIFLNTLESRRLELQRMLVEAEKAKYLEKVHQLTVQMLEALAQAIDAKDTYTNGHSYRVAEYSTLLAEELGFSSDEIENIRQEALLHDIGKIGIPDSVLNKPERLTDIEYKVMKSHTTLGEQILKHMIMIPGASAVAGGHHEKYDGTGYPKGLAGNEIYYHARIVGISDAYDAMNSDRIYRKALSNVSIREQLSRGRGTQFDPEYLDAFLKLFDEGKIKLRDADDKIPQSEMNHIEDGFKTFVNKISEKEVQNGAIEVNYRNFNEVYDFINRLAKRYSYTFKLIMITTKPVADAEISDIEFERTSYAMEMAIKKSIRYADIYTRYSKTQHLVVLMNTTEEYVDMIIQRIFLDYYKMFDTKKFELSYEIGDNMK